MLKKSLVFLLVLTCPILTLQAVNTQKTENPAHSSVKTDQLKSWYDQKKPMVVLDARSKEYFEGTLLPGAKWLPAGSTEKEIQATIPKLTSVVVVYCAGLECPASGMLYEKLKSMGYKYVFEYNEGLQEWLKRGFPTTSQK